MKLKTLLAVGLMLVAAVLAVACGGGDETTADPGTQAPGATTTAATTTKKTTTKKTTTKKTTVTTTTVVTEPREITFDIPAKLPDNKEYTAALVFDGTENDLAITDIKSNAAASSTDIFSLASGNKVFAYHIATEYYQAALNVNPYLLSGNESGYMFYVDISGVAANDATCIGPRVKIDAQWFQPGGHGNSILKQPDKVHNYGYYMVEGTGEWIKSENYDNCRILVPSQFKGWVYIPFDQMSYNGEGTLMLTDLLLSYPNECYFNAFMVYNGGKLCVEGQTVDCYFDNIIVVTAK